MCAREDKSCETNVVGKGELEGPQNNEVTE